MHVHIHNAFLLRQKKKKVWQASCEVSMLKKTMLHLSKHAALVVVLKVSEIYVAVCV